MIGGYAARRGLGGFRPAPLNMLDDQDESSSPSEAEAPAVASKFIAPSPAKSKKKFAPPPIVVDSSMYTSKDSGLLSGQQFDGGLGSNQDGTVPAKDGTSSSGSSKRQGDRFGCDETKKRAK